MIRAGGAIALVTSGFFVVLLFGRIRATHLIGTVAKYGNAPLTVELHQKPGSPWPRSSDLPSPFPAALEIKDDGRVCTLFFEDAAEEAREIPEDAEVVVTHRQVAIRALNWTFEGTRILSGSKSYRSGRTMLAFYGGLSMISAMPVVIWLIAAFASALLGRVVRTSGGSTSPANRG